MNWNRIRILLAAVIVVVANAEALRSARVNRRGPESGTLELTEREAPLQWIPGESSVCQLGIRWDAAGREASGDGGPDWLDAAKLAELGFDCSIPVTDGRARAHYASLPAREVYVLMEYEGAAWERAPADRRGVTRLFAVDAARELSGLRSLAAGSGKTAVVRGVVRISWRNDRGSSVAGASGPRLGGWLHAPLPGQVYVPGPWSAALAEFRRRDGELDRGGGRGKEPRYAVTVSWGARQFPWVSGVRRLEPAVPAMAPPERRLD